MLIRGLANAATTNYQDVRDYLSDDPIVRKRGANRLQERYWKALQDAISAWGRFRTRSDLDDAMQGAWVICLEKLLAAREAFLEESSRPSLRATWDDGARRFTRAEAKRIQRWHQRYVPDLVAGTGPSHAEAGIQLSRLNDLCDALWVELLTECTELQAQRLHAIGRDAFFSGRVDGNQKIAGQLNIAPEKLTDTLRTLRKKAAVLLEPLASRSALDEQWLAALRQALQPNSARDQ